MTRLLLAAICGLRLWHRHFARNMVRFVTGLHKTEHGCSIHQGETGVLGPDRGRLWRARPFPCRRAPSVKCGLSRTADSNRPF